MGITAPAQLVPWCLHSVPVPTLGRSPSPNSLGRKLGHSRWGSHNLEHPLWVWPASWNPSNLELKGHIKTTLSLSLTTCRKALPALLDIVYSAPVLARVEGSEKDP